MAAVTRKPKTDVGRGPSLKANPLFHCSVPSGLSGRATSQKFQDLWSCLQRCPTLMCGVFTFKQWLPSLTGFKNRQNILKAEWWITGLSQKERRKWLRQTSSTAVPQTFGQIVVKHFDSEAESEFLGAFWFVLTIPEAQSRLCGSYTSDTLPAEFWIVLFFFFKTRSCSFGLQCNQIRMQSYLY